MSFLKTLRDYGFDLNWKLLYIWEFFPEFFLMNWFYKSAELKRIAAIIDCYCTKYAFWN